VIDAESLWCVIEDDWSLAITKTGFCVWKLIQFITGPKSRNRRMVIDRDLSIVKPKLICCEYLELSLSGFFR